MAEIELKFLIDNAIARRLRTRVKSLGVAETAMPTRPRTLRTIYYDTPDHALARAGFALRLRREGRRWVQTVKTKRRHSGGLSVSEEFDCPAPGGRLYLERIPDDTARGAILTLAEGQPLEPVCETEMRRTACDLRLNGATCAELAIDLGEIRAGEASEPFAEVEIELKSGQVGALFDLTRELFAPGEMRLSHHSKAARGYMLAATGTIAPPLAPRTAKAVPLQPAMTAEQAMREILRECFDQIAANIDVVRHSDDPEGPHQLRIGLRRLRSAFDMFRDAIDSPEMQRLNAEARWLGQAVGRLRDLDVALADILVPEAAAHPEESGFRALAEALETRRGSVRKELHSELSSQRVHDFQIDLARFIEARGWLVLDDIGQTLRLAMPVAELGRAALDRRWRKATKRARGIETLEIEARHDLRKELKKLRYSLEFLAPLHPGKKVKPFVKRLKRLQTVFGDLNDAAMAQALFSGPEAPGARDVTAQRAAGWIIGARLERAAHQWEQARSLWDDLRRSGPFWR